MRSCLCLDIRRQGVVAQSERAVAAIAHLLGVCRSTISRTFSNTATEVPSLDTGSGGCASLAIASLYCAAVDSAHSLPTTRRQTAHSTLSCQRGPRRSPISASYAA